MADIFDGYKSRATTFIFTDPVTGDITGIPVDCTTSITTNMSAAVTNFPVEERSNVNDHVQPQPLTLSFSGFISESPSQKLLTLASSLATGALLSTGQFQGLSAAFATAFLSSAASTFASQPDSFDKSKPFKKLLTSRAENDPDYPKRAMLGLERMFRSGEPFDVRTYFSDEIYKNMIATSLSFTQDSQMGDSLNFSMTAQKLTTVKQFKATPTEIKMADRAGTSAADATEEGKKTPKEVGPDSLLLQTTQGIGGLF